MMEHWGKWTANYGKNELIHFFHEGQSMSVLSDAFSLAASYLAASEISVLSAPLAKRVVRKDIHIILPAPEVETIVLG
jgi:hypothetical protein